MKPWSKEKDLSWDQDFEKKLKDGLLRYPRSFESLWAANQRRLERKRQPLFRWRFYLAAGLSSFAVFFVAFLWLSKPFGMGNYTLSALSGDVKIIRSENGKALGLKAGDKITGDSRVVTGPQGTCDITDNKDTLIRLYSLTDLKVPKQLKNSVKTISLDSGKIAFNHRVVQGQENVSLKIESAGVLIQPAGTRFIVNNDKGSNTTVAVLEGKVYVEPDLSPVDKWIKEQGEILQSSNAQTKNEYRWKELSEGQSVSVSKDVVRKVNTAIQSELAASLSLHKKLDLALFSEVFSNAVVKQVKVYQEQSILGILSSNDQAELENMALPEQDASKSGNVRVRIETLPAGAVINIVDRYTAPAPLEIIAVKGETLVIQATLPDFQDKITNIKADSEMIIRMNFETNTAGTSSSSAGMTLVPAQVISDKTIASGVNFIQTSVNYLKVYSETGAVVREIQVEKEPVVLTRPVESKGVVYFGSANGGLYAYQTDGKLLWKNQDAGQARFNAYPVTGDGVVILPTFDKGVELFTLDGKLVRQIAVGTKEAVYAAPLFIKGLSILVVGSENGTLTGYHIESGKELWSRKDLIKRVVNPVIGDGDAAVVLSRSEGVLRAINPENGTDVWSGVYPELVKTDLNPVFYRKIIAASANKNGESLIILINALNGKEIKRIKLNNTIKQQVLIDNTLYSILQNGEVEGLKLN